MKSFFITPLLALSSLLLSQVSEVRNLNAFSKIQVGYGIELEITQNSNYHLEVFTDNTEKLSDIITEVKNNELILSVKNKNTQKNNYNSQNYKVLKVEVSLPSLTELYANSGSSVIVNNIISSTNFTLNTSSGSNVKGDFDIKNTMAITAESGSYIAGKITSSHLNVITGSGSSVNLEGKTQHAEYAASSGSSLKAKNLKAQNVSAQSSSASYISLNAEKKLTANASSVAKIHYSGNPTVTTNTSSLGKIEKL